MKLHWSPRSPFVRKVMVAAHELGLADRIQTTRTLVGAAIVAPALLPDNPLNKIPTLVLEDGTVLYDSYVIIEYLDSLAGVVGGGRRLDHNEVLRLRNANPHESLEVLAMRLGCSLSTIKRHMRRARSAAGEVRLAAVKPTLERVLAAFEAVVRPNRSRERRVA